jgi:hypothetical protein
VKLIDFSHEHDSVTHDVWILHKQAEHPGADPRGDRFLCHSLSSSRGRVDRCLVCFPLLHVPSTNNSDRLSSKGTDLGETDAKKILLSCMILVSRRLPFLVTMATPSSLVLSSLLELGVRQLVKALEAELEFGLQ